MNRSALTISLSLACLIQSGLALALHGCEKNGVTVYSQQCLHSSAQLIAAAPQAVTAPATSNRCNFDLLRTAIGNGDIAPLQRCQLDPGLLSQGDQRRASSGRTLLHWAVAKQQLAAARTLIQRGSPLDIGSRSDKGGQPIHLATASGHTVMINLLLNHGADSEARDYFRQTPLHWASKAGQLDTVQQLIRMGANPNSQDRTGKSPLMLAIRNNHPEVTALLLKSGADPSLVSNSGNSALHLAANRSIELVKQLLPQLPIDLFNAEGQSPLMYAAATNPQRHWTTIRYLIQQGAKTDLRDNQLRGLLDYSLEHNHLPLFELLLEQGLDSDRLTLGQFKGKPAFIRRLIELNRL